MATESLRDRSLLFVHIAGIYKERERYRASFPPTCSCTDALALLLEVSLQGICRRVSSEAG